MKIFDDAKLAICIASAMILGFLPTFVLPLEVGALIAGLNLTEGQAGLLGTVEIFSLALCSMILPNWLSNWSPGRVVKFGFLICASSQILSAFSVNYELIVLLRCLNGVGSALLLASANSIIATSRTPEVLYGKVFGIMLLVDALVLTLLPFALHFGEYRGLYLALGALAILLLPLSLPLSKRSFEQVGGGAAQPIPLLRVALFFFVITVLYLIMGGVYSFIERIGVGIGVSRDAIGIMLGVSAFFGMAGAIFSAWLGLRLGRLLPVISIFLAVGLTCSILVLTNNSVAYIICVALYGFLYPASLSYVLGIAVALDNTGRLSTATLGYSLIPYSLGPAFFGFMGLAAIIEYGWLLAVVCLVIVVMIYPLICLIENNELERPHLI